MSECNEFDESSISSSVSNYCDSSQSNSFLPEASSFVTELPSKGKKKIQVKIICAVSAISYATAVNKFFLSY